MMPFEWCLAVKEKNRRGVSLAAGEAKQQLPGAKSFYEESIEIAMSSEDLLSISAKNDKLLTSLWR